MSTTFRAYDATQTFHDVWDAPHSAQSHAPPHRRSLLQRVTTLMIIVLLACNLMFLYMQFRTHQRQAVIDSQIEKIDKVIESADSGRLFVIPHATPIPAAAEVSLLPAPTWSDPQSFGEPDPTPPSRHAPYQRRYVTEMKGHCKPCKPCKNCTLRTSSTDDK